MSDPKLAAARAALQEALNETDDRGTRFYIREALQHLTVIESRRERSETEDDSANGVVAALSVGRGDPAGGADLDSLETAEFPAEELDRN